MSKLYSLKEYLSLDDAAKRLSLELKDNEINIFDILDLVVSEQLRLSVKPTHSQVKAIFCEIQKPIANLGGLQFYATEDVDRFVDNVQVGGNVSSRLKLTGYNGLLINLKDECWNFPLIGGNKLAIENYKRKLQGKNLINSFEGYIYLKGTELYLKLYHPKEDQLLLDKKASMIENYDPVANINDDLELVIKRIDLDNFIQSLFVNEDEINFQQSKTLMALVLKALKEKGSKSWSQDDLSTYISEEFTVHGLGKTKINKFFSQCNKLIKSNK